MKYLVPIIIITILGFPLLAQAWVIGGIDLCMGLEPNAMKLCNLLWDIQQILYGLSLAIAVLFIIIGGIIYMTAGESEDKTKTSKKMITNALIGFAIVLSFSFLIGIVREIITNSLK